MASSIPPNYVLGQSAYEYERLTLQANVLRPFTEKFFTMAGIRSGMRVLVDPSLRPLEPGNMSVRRRTGFLLFAVGFVVVVIGWFFPFGQWLFIVGSILILVGLFLL